MKNLNLLCAWLAAAALLGGCGGGGGGGEPVAPAPVVTASSATSVKYSDTLLITLVGNNLDQPLALSSSGCRGFARSTAAPNISSATTAYYTCTVAGATGNLNVTVTAGGVTAATVPFAVAVPQVSMIVTNGAGVSGTLVITLDPSRTPLTVDNFLAYVKSGFYNNTAFHRHGKTAAGGEFVLQGGGYAAPVSSSRLFPAPKATSAPIALESGLSNLRYTVAMARTSVANSATSEFFINTVDNAFLDTLSGGYAAFGTVTTGTAVVDAMTTAPCAPSATNFGLNSPDCVPEPNLVVASAQQTR